MVIETKTDRIGAGGRAHATFGFLRARLADLILGLAGLLVGLPSLYEPFGRDQGLYFYIGREWLLRGRLPYRDTFDIKTPGIYALHALSIAVFGEHTWAIRILDLVAVAGLGVSVAFLVRRAPRPGAVGLAIFVASLFYYGLFDFWNKAQCEIWCTAFTMASLAAAARVPSRRGREPIVVAGLLFALAVSFKPPALLALPVLIAILARRAWGTKEGRVRRLFVMLALLAASGGALAMLVVGYFAARGGLEAMFDILVVNNRHYVVDGAWVHSWSDVLDRLLLAQRILDPLVIPPVLVLSMGAVIAWRRGDRRGALRRALPAALVLVALAGVIGQLKFCWYHWGLFVGPIALVIAVIGEEIASALSHPRAQRLWLPATVALFVSLFAFTGTSAMSLETNPWGVTKAAIARMTGRMTHDEYIQRFAFTAFPYSVPVSEHVGQWLRDNTSPDDRVAIRGFEPLMYAVAGRYFPGRFFWTSFLTMPEWAYRMDRWVEEDRDVFRNTPPRFVVAPTSEHAGVNAEEYFVPFGYVRRALVDGWAILEHKS